MDYEFAEYSPTLLDQVVALRIREWGEDPQFSASYLAWKYEQNPYFKKPLFYIALSAGKVVGMRGMYGANLTAGPDGARFAVAAGSDTLVVPEHRGQRLFTGLTRYALADLTRQGCDFALSLSANRTSELLSLRSGWVRVCAFQPLYWGERPEPAAQQRRREAGIKAALRRARSHAGVRTAWAYFKRLARRSRGPAFQELDAWTARSGPAGSIAVEASARAKQMTQFILSHQRHDPRIHLTRDEQYYDWRFKDPRSAYRFVYAEAGSGDLDGFLVLQQPRSGGDVAIVDWQSTSEQVWRQMVQAVIDSGSIRGLSVWSATLPPSLAGSLLDLGFRPGDEPDTRTHPAQGLLVTPTLEGLPQAAWTLGGSALLQTEQWDLRMLLSDLY